MNSWREKNRLKIDELIFSIDCSVDVVVRELRREKCYKFTVHLQIPFRSETHMNTNCNAVFYRTRTYTASALNFYSQFTCTNKLHILRSKLVVLFVHVHALNTYTIQCVPVRRENLLSKCHYYISCVWLLPLLFVPVFGAAVPASTY